jgi:hypothetical protein
MGNIGFIAKYIPFKEPHTPKYVVSPIFLDKKLQDKRYCIGASTQKSGG